MKITMPLKLKIWQGAAIAAAASLALIAGLAISFQDNITKFNLEPRTPFQTYTPPAPPSYDARDAWAIWPDTPQDSAADIFYIHSTTFSERAGWNGPLDDKDSTDTLQRAAAPNEAGPFLSVGAVYGPRYRQATLFASFTHKYDGRSAFELAYLDVEEAFSRFLSVRAPRRPIILVGYGQGGLHALGLLQHHFAADEELRRHLAAAYIFNVSLSESLFEAALGEIPVCDSPSAVRCVIGYIDLEAGFDEEARRFRERALFWNDKKKLISAGRARPICVNPLSWRANDEKVDRAAHLGAASATGLALGETPAAIPGAVDAQCKDGILIVSRPQQDFLKRRRWFGDHWRPQDFNLFFHDLTADAERRTANLAEILDREWQILTPIEDSVDLGVSPINKAPE